MQMFDFFSRAELAAAPPQPEEAFLHIVELAYQRLSERTDPMDRDNDWDQINEARHGFMNVVVGLAKNYAIEPIASMQVPSVENYGNPHYRQFKADLDHYVVQLVGRQVREEREDSVALVPETKERLRTHLHHIRVCIDKAEMPDAKRAKLFAKLTEFEAALEKDRLSLAQVMKFLMGMGMTGLALSDSQTMHRLLDKVVEAVAEVHAIEDEQRKLPPLPALVALVPPRPAEPKRSRSSAETFSADLDDEIPF